MKKKALTGMVSMALVAGMCPAAALAADQDEVQFQVAAQADGAIAAQADGDAAAQAETVLVDDSITLSGDAQGTFGTWTVSDETIASLGAPDQKIVYNNDGEVSAYRSSVAVKGLKEGTVVVKYLAADGSEIASYNVEVTVIKANDLVNATVAKIEDQPYTGTEIKPALDVTIGDGVKLVEGTDYEVAFKDNVERGTATATITGKGDYIGSTSATFSIVVASIDKATVTANPATAAYQKGIALEPAVTVELNGTKLIPNTDYEVAYANNKEVGTASIIVTGKGNYTGTAQGSFIIKEDGPTLTRLAGEYALETMFDIVTAGNFATGGTVVLATSEGYWDALTAAGIAGMANAPVVMTNGSVLSYQSSQLIKSLAPKQIIVCGGEAALSKSVADEAAKAAGGEATVVRAYGETATGTAVDIFNKAAEATGGTWSNAAFICTNQGYWDALAAAPISYSKHMPIFLTEGANSISDETLAAMKGKINRVYIVGGTAAVSDKVAYQIERAGIRVSGRLGGADAIETSEKVANLGIEASGISAENVGIATTGGYWDALSGAALCGKKGGVLVLADGPQSSSVTGFIKTNASSIKNAYIFGGEAAISEATEDAIRDILGIEEEEPAASDVKEGLDSK